MQKKLSFRVDVIVEADSNALVKDAADSLIGKIPHVIKDNQYDNYAAVVRDAYLLGEIAHISGHEQYGARDAMELDMQGLYYCRHVHAMTREGLVAKSDIAAELGYRDWQIDDLNHALTIALNSVEEISHLAVSAIRGEKSPEELLQRVAITFERNVELLKSLKPSFAMEMTYPTEMMVDGKAADPVEVQFVKDCEDVAANDTFKPYVRTTERDS
jgi:hypothetical protein